MTPITKFNNVLTVTGNPSQLKKFKDKFTITHDDANESFAMRTLKKLDFFYMYLDLNLTAKEFVEKTYKAYPIKELFDVLYENYQYIYIDPTQFNSKNMDESLELLFELAIKYINFSEEDWEDARVNNRKFLRNNTPIYSFLNIIAPNNFTRFRMGLPAVPDHLSFDEWCLENYDLDLKVMKSLRIELVKDKKSMQRYEFVTPRNGMKADIIRKLSKAFPKLEFEFESGDRISQEIKISTNVTQVICKNGKQRKSK